ncbi:MAG TPA: class II aldolase/adducin family protein [Vicinamibacterales bacterium]|jgi:HCOMODA/2-hydroxy-3-carboxy-muconic semialdehyde decarboxylase
MNVLRQGYGGLVERRAFLTALSAFAAIALERFDVAAAQAPGASLDSLVDDLVAGNRILAMENVLDGMGHISARHPGRAGRFLLARSVAPELVTRDDIMEFDFDGMPVDAKGRTPYKERFIHSEIYRVRQDVNAIVHCHAPSLIPFADTRVPLRAMYHMAAFVAEGVPVFDIRAVAGVTDLLVSDAKLGKALAQALGSKPAALMKYHGAVVVASSVPNVVGRSVYLDINARVQIQAMTLGGGAGTFSYIDPAEARLRMADPNEYSRAWELWKRKLGRPADR